MDVSLATLLVRPRAAFEAADERLSLVQPLVLVFLVGASSIATAFPVYVALQRRLSSDIATVEFVIGAQTARLPLWFAIGTVGGILVVLVGWVVTTALLHGAARLAGGRGRFRRLLAFVGWSHAPYVVVYPLVALVAAWQLATTPGATLNGVLHGTSGVDGTMVTFNGRGLIDVSSIPSLAVTLWIGYVWIGALDAAYDLSRRRATAVAAVATVVMLVAIQLPGYSGH